MAWEIGAYEYVSDGVTGSGTLTSNDSSVSGVAEREISASGALTAQDSTASGSGTVSAAITGSGSLQSEEYQSSTS